MKHFLLNKNEFEAISASVLPNFSKGINLLFRKKSSKNRTFVFPDNQTGQTNEIQIFEEKPNEKDIYMISAPPGSGKSYSSLEKAIKIANQGYLCIVTFPNKSLLDANEKLANKLKDEMKLNVDIFTHSLNSSMEPVELFPIFIKGKAIILTLYAYFNIQGDFFKFSNIYCLFRVFNKKAFLFVDEAHSYLNSCQTQIQITHGSVYKKINNTKFTIQRSSQIRNLKDYKTYEISDPILYVEEPSVAIRKFAQPKEIPSKQENLFLLFEKKDFDSLYGKYFEQFGESMQGEEYPPGEENAQVEEILPGEQKL